jgi:hypothetical protein
VQSSTTTLSFDIKDISLELKMSRKTLTTVLNAKDGISASNDLVISSSNFIGTISAIEAILLALNLANTSTLEIPSIVVDYKASSNSLENHITYSENRNPDQHSL